MSATTADARRVTMLGVATGARCFVAPATLALRDRLGDGKVAKVARAALPVLAAGEIVGDKLSFAPPRVQGGGLLGRVASGAFAGHTVGGARGARLGAAVALASTYPSQALRAAIVAHTPVPDFAWAVPEDLAVIALAATAVDGPKTPPWVEFSAHQPGGWDGIVTGVGAALVGVGATVTARQWMTGLVGDKVSPRVTAALAAGVGIVAAAVAYEAFAA